MTNSPTPGLSRSSTTYCPLAGEWRPGVVPFSSPGRASRLGHSPSAHSRWARVAARGLRFASRHHPGPLPAGHSQHVALRASTGSVSGPRRPFAHFAVPRAGAPLGALRFATRRAPASLLAAYGPAIWEEPRGQQDGARDRICDLTVREHGPEVSDGKGHPGSLSVSEP
jgi:hypothetical protein